MLRASRRSLSGLDSLLIRRCGLPYLLITRDRMIHERMRYLVDEVVKTQQKVAVLDAGCGSGMALFYLDHYCRGSVTSYTGVDLNTERIARRYSFISTPHSFHDVDLDSDWKLQGFDIIFCSEVIEHLVNDERLLRRLANHLNPRGILLLTTPNKRFVRHWAETFAGFDEVSQTQDGGHVRVGYNRKDLETLAKRVGLAIRDQLFLSRMAYGELRHREQLRKHGQHVNTVRYNWRWLIGSEVKRHDRCGHTLTHWTVAVALAHPNASGQTARLCDAAANS